MSSIATGPVQIEVGDVLSMPTREFRWWERALRRLTFGRYRMKGYEVRRNYVVTSVGVAETITIAPPPSWASFWTGFRSALQPRPAAPSEAPRAEVAPTRADAERELQGAMDRYGLKQSDRRHQAGKES